MVVAAHRDAKRRPDVPDNQDCEADSFLVE